jgi:acyl dehydratase
MTTTVMNLEAVGSQSEPYEVSWAADDAALYALAVGAGHDDPQAELNLTTETTDDRVQQVVPTFALCLSQQGITRRMPIGTFERSALVHAEQSLTVLGPLPTSGRGTATARLDGIYDKRSGALARISIDVVDPDTGANLWTSRLGYFVRGAGGFGGDSVATEPWSASDRPADRTVRASTWPGQALLYRLTGDRNPLHSEPEYARRARFDRPILHGLATYGVVARTLLAHLAGGDQARFQSMDARFSKPVYPGDELSIEVWDDSDAHLFRVSGPDGNVLLDRGRLQLSN